MSRQWVYREAKQIAAIVEGTQTQQEMDRYAGRASRSKRVEMRRLQQRLAQPWCSMMQHKRGSLVFRASPVASPWAQCRTLLNVLIPGKALSVASLGRRTHAAGVKAGLLLAVFDEYTQPLSCRWCGRRDLRQRSGPDDGGAGELVLDHWPAGNEVSGSASGQEFARLPNLEQLVHVIAAWPWPRA